jgi:hypothetical protein
MVMMGLPGSFGLSFLVALMAGTPAFAQNCGGSVDQSEQFRRQLYKATTGTCQPGTEVKYQTISSTLPYFELKYIENGRAIPMVCRPHPGDCGCSSMIQDGESFKTSDLQRVILPKEGEKDTFVERVEKVFHVPVKIAETALKFGGVAVPLGDGASAFLSDIGERLDDHANEKDKIREAAEQLRKIFGSLLKCKDETHASYKDGMGVEKGLMGLFIDLSQDKKIDMGDNAVPTVDASKLLEAVANARRKPIETIPSKINGDLTSDQASSDQTINSVKELNLSTQSDKSESSATSVSSPVTP